MEGGGAFGQDREDNVIDFNSPPGPQPGLWCQWCPSEDRKGIEWDGGEKFYRYAEWLEYLVDKVLAPKGYVLNGEVEWQGEDRNDRGVLKVVDNVVEKKEIVGYVLA